MADQTLNDADTAESILYRGEPAELILDDGSRFAGFSFGAPRATTGEAVFQTGKAAFKGGRAPACCR